MLYSVFPQFLNMSLTAAIVILLVALLRPLLRRAPRAVTFLLWAVVLFRMVCPVSFSADFSLLFGGNTVDHSLQYIPAQLVEDTLQMQSAPPAAVITETVTEVVSGSAGRTDFARLLLILGTWGWICGILVFLAVGLFSVLRVKRCCIGAVRLSAHAYLADHIQVPFVLGIFRPRIYLPSSLNDAQTQHILQHEETHIARGDHIWKLLAYLALSLHWFNPIAWLGFHLFVQDMETACDESVLRSMDENTRADYAETLLCVSTGRRFPNITPAFGEDNPKTRIKSILRYKKPVTVITAFAILVAVVAAVLLLVNPKTATGPAGEVIPEFPNFSTSPTHYSYHQEPHGKNGEATNSFENPVFAYAAYDVLKNLEVEVSPASQSRAEDREKIFTYAVGTADNMIYFYFDESCKHM